MASQNLPGFATLRAAGYEPPVSAALTTTGLISTVTAFFGAHTVSMAAITAAISAFGAAPSLATLNTPPPTSGGGVFGVTTQIARTFWACGPFCP
jgi:hypothetical protein